MAVLEDRECTRCRCGGRRSISAYIVLFLQKIFKVSCLQSSRTGENWSVSLIIIGWLTSKLPMSHSQCNIRAWVSSNGNKLCSLKHLKIWIYQIQRGASTPSQILNATKYTIHNLSKSSSIRNNHLEHLCWDMNATLASACAWSISLSILAFSSTAMLKHLRFHWLAVTIMNSCLSLKKIKIIV